ncbi:MAG: serpin family protein [candidate division Zixibacteria bacterium]|nr:serpin family protein [candidate division Zixibacteria bacterium]
MRLFVCLLAGTVILVGCQGNPAVSKTENNNAEKSKAVVDDRLVQANTRFGFKMFAELAKHSAEANIFVSAPSVAIALTMTYNGADSTTRDAMASALELEGLSLDQVNQANRALKSLLENPDSAVTLSIANSLWAREGLPFLPDFMNRNKEFYGARVTSLNFDDPGAAPTINTWVSENTHEKIQQIVDAPIDQGTILFLINAIYFKGAWTRTFDKARTVDGRFTPLSGAGRMLPFMHQSGSYPYLKGDGFQAVSLPYGKGRVSMYIFLPNEGTNLATFQSGLTAASWEQWMAQFAMQEGDIALPRFKLEYEANLNSVLASLGMGIAFDGGRANFSKMFPISQSRNVFISKVKHKTFVDVNEEGTEAAAVTSVEVGITSIREPQERFNFIVDRPFFFAIRDNQTGTILFMGSIVNP